MAAVSTPWFVVRNVYLVLITLFLLAILVQAYFAGRFIFGVDVNNSDHAGLGWPLAHTFAPLLFLVSLFTRGGKQVWITSIVWVAAAFALPLLAVVNETGSSPVEALHPPLAMVLLGLTLFLNYRAAMMVADGRTAPTPQSMARSVPKAGAP